MKTLGQVSDEEKGLAADFDASNRLERLEAELEAAQEEGVRFSRAVSHGLAAPLTSTRWLLEALRERLAANLSDDARKLIDTALKNLDEMTGLIEAQSTHYRMGQKSLNARKATSARKAVDTALEKLRVEIVRLQAQITVGPLPAVTVEPDALVCMFENLIGNALKFQPAGRIPNVLITAVEQKGRWLFQIEDNGIGIDSRNAERIFEPLQRLNADIPGRGIGLATCRKIVQRTGGQIWVEPAPTSGSVFCFTLPGEGSREAGEGRPVLVAGQGNSSHDVNE